MKKKAKKARTSKASSASNKSKKRGAKPEEAPIVGESIRSVGFRVSAGCILPYATRDSTPLWANFQKLGHSATSFIPRPNDTFSDGSRVGGIIFRTPPL